MGWRFALLIVAASVLSDTSNAQPNATQCEPTFSEAILCFNPATAARNAVTFARDHKNIERFRFQLAEQGCGTASTLSRRADTPLTPIQSASVATATGVVDVVQLTWTTKAGQPISAWAATTYLPPQCKPAASPPPPLARPTHLLPNPQWRRQPTREDLSRYRPSGLTTAGRAKLRCSASEDGRLSDCDVLSEDPAGIGVADAALLVSRLYRLQVSDGVGGAIVELEIQFPRP